MFPLILQELLDDLLSRPVSLKSSEKGVLVACLQE
jgi:hypothetical protein